MRLSLKAERIKRGLTQEYVAFAVGLKSKQAYSRIELGQRNPSWEVAEQLERFFGIPASELLAEEEEETTD